MLSFTTESQRNRIKPPLHSITYVNCVTHCVRFQGSREFEYRKSVSAHSHDFMVSSFWFCSWIYSCPYDSWSSDCITLALALVNHNAEHTLDVRSRNKALDWGEAQLHVSADWAVNSFIYAHGLPLAKLSHGASSFSQSRFFHHPAISRFSSRHVRILRSNTSMGLCLHFG